jgi:hypothetical protein
MSKYVDTFYRVSTRAFMRDSKNNEYTGEQLMLALLLHAKGTSRTIDGEKEVGALLDDPNQKGKHNVKRTSQRRTGRKPSKTS